MRRLGLVLLSATMAASAAAVVGVMAARVILALT
jgi:hypothetical protein